MLSQILTKQIDQLRGTFSAISDETPILISARSDTVGVSTQIVDCDRLGYLLTSVKAEQLTGSNTEIDYAQIGDRISMLLERVTYLTEKLTLVEKASDLSRVLIRSAKPDQRSGEIYYFELTLNAGNSIHLERQCYDFETHRRKIVPFTLAPNIFADLVNEFEDILGTTEVYVESSEILLMDRDDLFEAYLLS
jgi:hypothetical protein